MTELEIEELERKVTRSDRIIVADTRSAEALPDRIEDVRNVCWKWEHLFIIIYLYFI